MVARHTGLSSITLSCYLCHASAAMILRFLPAAIPPSVTKLCIDNVPADAGMRLINLVKARMPALQSLALQNCAIDDGFLVAIGASVRKAGVPPATIEIDLSDNPAITIVGICELSKASSWPALRRLQLPRHLATDAPHLICARALFPNAHVFVK
jgi:hypothetical protein